MTGEEIRKKILFNNQLIKEKSDPSTFVFQKEVVELMEQNEELQKLCPHIYENGECIYCGLKN